jgi:hypothetical protein
MVGELVAELELVEEPPRCDDQCWQCTSTDCIVKQRTLETVLDELIEDLEMKQRKMEDLKSCWSCALYKAYNQLPETQFDCGRCDQECDEYTKDNFPPCDPAPHMIPAGQ